jgi:hypothetical protein
MAMLALLLSFSIGTASAGRCFRAGQAVLFCRETRVVLGRGIAAFPVLLHTIVEIPASRRFPPRCPSDLPAAASRRLSSE